MVLDHLRRFAEGRSLFCSDGADGMIRLCHVGVPFLALISPDSLSFDILLLFFFPFLGPT